MKASNKNKEILKSRIFWKIYGWLLAVMALLLGFAAFIILSNIEAELGQVLFTGKIVGGYTLLKKQILIILIILYIIFASFGFFSVRLLASKIIRVSQYLKNINKKKAAEELNMSTNDEFKDIALDLNNLSINLREYKEKKVFIDKIKSDFVAIAAHQLRTPLSKIKWALYALKESKLNKEQSEYVEDSIETSEHMIVLINNLLSVNRIERGKFNYDFQHADIKKVIRSAIKDFRPQCKEAGLKLSKNIYKEELKIRHDPEKIKMVMDNLLSNAVKYTPEGGRVNVSAKLKSDILEVMVRDNGMGIPKPEQAKVFRRFFRGEKMKVDAEGNGLGLFIAKNIIEKHGGEIGFQSQHGKGSTFYFTIPIKGREDPQKSFREMMNKV